MYVLYYIMYPEYAFKDFRCLPTWKEAAGKHEGATNIGGVQKYNE